MDEQSYYPPAPSTGEQPSLPPMPQTDRRFPGCWLSLVVIIGFWSVLIGLQIVAIIVLAVGQAATGSPMTQIMSNATFAMVLQGFGMVLATALIVGITYLVARRSLWEIIPIHRSPVLIMVPIFIFAVGQAILLSEVDNLLQMIMPMPDWLHQVMMQMVGGGWASVLVVVIIAPLTEEAVFRGVILNGLRKRFPPWTAVALSSVMFGFYHINPYQWIGPGIIGLMLGWLRLRTGSLWPPIALHAFNNGLAMLTVKLDIPIPGLNYALAGQSFQPWWLDLGGVLLTAIGIALILWMLPKKPPAEPELPDRLQPQHPHPDDPRLQASAAQPVEPPS